MGRDNDLSAVSFNVLFWYLLHTSNDPNCTPNISWIPVEKELVFKMQLTSERHSVRWYRSEVNNSDGSSCWPIKKQGNISLIRRAKPRSIDTAIRIFTVTAPNTAVYGPK
jgi:hypothetical protein